jgi:hypothetical protein
VRVSPRSLLPLPGRRVRLSENWPVWSFSPDRSRLVIKDKRVVGLSLGHWLRVVDTTTLRTVRWLPPASKVISHLVWLTPRRVVAIEPGDESFDVVLVDTKTPRIVSRRTVPGWVNVNAFVRTQRAVVVLVSRPREIGPPRLVVAGADGTVRSVVLEEISAGTVYPEHDDSWSTNADPSRFVGHRRWPGLAVDPIGAHAYVVDPGGTVADVGLDDLSVRYHDLAAPRSLLGRLTDWLEPDAHAKGALEGPARHARWLGGGLIALSGEDESAFVDARGTLQVRSRAAGLMLIDTRDWHVRTLDERASRFVVGAGAGLLLATGWSSGPENGKQVGMGLAAYALDGTKRFEAFRDQTASVSYVVGRRAYVGVANQLRIVDLSSGGVSGTVIRRMPSLLIED